MPPIGFLLSGVDFKDSGINLGTAAKPVLIKYGVFIQSIIDFAIIAFVLFMVIKAHEQDEEALETAAAPRRRRRRLPRSTSRKSATRW